MSNVNVTENVKRMLVNCQMQFRSMIIMNMKNIQHTKKANKNVHT